MKKTVAVIVVGLMMVAAVATVAMAAPGGTGVNCWWNNDKMTDAQKQEMAPLVNQMTDLHKQMVEVRKQMIQKQVGFGNLTQDQANEMFKRMDERMQQGYGPGMGHPGHKGHHGYGMMGNGNAANCPQQP